MQPALHMTTKVLPGKRIEITAPELNEGDLVEVFLIAPGQSDEPPRSALEIIESLRGHRLFQTPEEVDKYLEAERDAWER